MLEKKIKQFLLELNVRKNSEFLLALSGGIDSLALFLCLESLIKEIPFSFHVAHVDHGWRESSQKEAAFLKNWIEKKNIPFHSKRLDPLKFTGNQENFCREERRKFFLELVKKYSLSGVFLAHHKDDQNETIFKRILEGASFFNFSGMKKNTLLENVLFFRPFLEVSKKEIETWMEKREEKTYLIQDLTNQDEKFLRTRMRKKIFPFLQKEWGKNVKENLFQIGEEAKILQEFLEEEIEKSFPCEQKGPLGSFWDFSEKSLPHAYLLRFFFKKKIPQASKDTLNKITQAIIEKKANIQFFQASFSIIIDRRRIFLLPKEPYLPEISIHIQSNHSFKGGKLKEELGWKNLWKGKMSFSLPQNKEVHFRYASSNELFGKKSTTLSKWWNLNKVPQFLWNFFPIVEEGRQIILELLSGKNRQGLEKKEEMKKNFEITIISLNFSNFPRRSVDIEEVV